MGTVHLAEVTEPHGGLIAGQQVALKRLALATDSARARFRSEVEALRKVTHPGLPRLLAESSSQQEQAWIAMEPIEGESVQELIRRDGAMPEALVRHVGRELALALSALHTVGVVHRDVKPANVLLTPEGRVVLVDLGVAWLAGEGTVERHTVAGGHVGTWAYAAPEQLRNPQAEPGPRADLYGLGATLFEALTGQLWVHARSYSASTSESEPLNIMPPEAAADAVTAAGTELAPASVFVRALLGALLDADAHGRPRSALEVAAAFDAGESSDWFGRWLAATKRRPGKRPLRLVRKGEPWVGRAREVAQIEAAYEHAAAGAGGLVWVCAPSGSGKTHLMDKVFDLLSDHARPPLFLHGAHEPGILGGPTRAIADALEMHFGPDRLRSELAVLLPDRPELVRRLVATIRGEPGSGTAPALDASAFQAACSRLLAAMAREHPLVLVVEDLHHASEEAMQLVLGLGARARRSRVLVLATSREGPAAHLAGEVRRMPRGTWMPLPPLDADASRELLKALVESAQPLSRAHREALVTRAEGSPLALKELLRQAGGDGEHVLPESLAQLQARRLGSLAPDERHLLELASCLGARFDPRELAALAAETSDLPTRTSVLVVLRMLGEIARRTGALVPHGVEFQFGSLLTHEYVRRLLPTALRRELHVFIAKFRERSGAAPEETVPHWLEAGSYEDAARGLEDAVRRLALRHETERALHLAEAALQLATPGSEEWVRTCTTLLQVAEDAGRLGSYVDEATSLDDRSAETGPDEARRESALWRARVALARGEFSTVREQANRAREGVAADPGGGVEELMLLGLADLHEGIDESARAHFMSAAQLTTTADDPDVDLRIEGNLALLADRAGNRGEALQRLARLAGRLQATGAQREEARARANLAFVLSRAGLKHEARVETRTALELAREVGDRRLEAVSLGNLAALEERMGALAAALGLYEEDELLAQEIGDQAGALMALANRAHLLGQLGSLEAGLKLLQKLVTQLDATSDPYVASVAYRYRARLQRFSARPDEALRQAALALAGAPDEEERALSLIEEAHARVELGDVPAAAECLRAAASLARELELTSLAFQAEALLGALDDSGSGLDAAGHHAFPGLPVLAAISVLSFVGSRMEWPYWVARAHVAWRRASGGLPDEVRRRAERNNPVLRTLLGAINVGMP